MKVLSWNICWGCMSSDSYSHYDRTAIPLPGRCRELKNTHGYNICLADVAKFIAENNYHIIALQEAKNWQEILAYVNCKHGRAYNYINYKLKNSSGNYVEIVTFYNKNYMKPRRIYYGNLGTGSDIRPYEVILFDLSAGVSIYFVNLHNGHGFNKKKIEVEINNNKNYFNIAPSETTNIYEYNIEIEGQKSIYINNIDKTGDKHFLLTPETETETAEMHQVIVAGDFNDHGTQKFWETGLTIKGQNVTSKGIQPPPTCCTPMDIKYSVSDSDINTVLRSPSHNTDTLYGDYILISDGLRYIHGNEIPPPQFIPQPVIPPQFNKDAINNPTSDHLPIEATISNIGVEKTGGKRRRRTKRIKTKRRYRKKTKRNY